MKRLLSILTGSLLAAIVFVTPASAATCVIYGTGPNSVNSCVNNDIDETIFYCVNNTSIDSNNVQSGTSGTATVGGNGSGGNASSGNVSNQTIQDIQARLGCDEETPVTPVTPTTPVTPAVTTTTTPVAEIKALPKTGVSDVLLFAVVAVAGLSSAIGITHFVVARNRNNA